MTGLVRQNSNSSSSRSSRLRAIRCRSAAGRTLACLAILGTSLALLSGLSGSNPARASESSLPLHAQIDQLVEAALIGQPAPLASDAEFIRRIHLDLIGRIPDSITVREFLADESPDKRAVMIDRLLDSPEHVRHLANVFDVMLMERRRHKHVTQAEWDEYLLEAFAQRKPLLQLVKELLSSDGTVPELRGAARFFLEREVEPNLLTRDISRIFLGRDIQCSQCHDHPLVDDYYQSEYYGLYAFVGRSSLFVDAKNENKALIAEKGEGDISYKSVFTEIEGESRPQLLDQATLDEPVFAEGDEYVVKPEKDVRSVPKYSRRARLADELTRGDHPAFRRNIANRLWAWMMGRGLVEPVDLHHSGNPAEHAEVLQLLGDAMAERDFDLREILRELAQTRVYQRSVEPGFDWLEQVRRGAEQRAEIESLQEAATRQRDEAIRVHDELLVSVRSLRSEVAPLEQTFREARKAEAKGAFELREATTKLTMTQEQLAARESVLAAVKGAATAAQEAAAVLPDEAELASATAKFVKKAESIASEVTELGKSLEEHQQAVASAETSHLGATEALQVAEQAFQSAAAPLREQEAHLRQLASQLEQHKQRRQVVDRQLTRLRTLETRQEPLLEQLALQQQLEQLATARGELQRRLELKDEPRVAAVENAEPVAVILAGSAADEADSQQVDQKIDGEANKDKQDEQDEKDEVVEKVDPGEMQRQLAELDAQKLALEERLAELTPAVQVAQQELEDVWTRQLALAPLKTLSPEQLAWSVLEATGVLAAHRHAVEKELDEKEEAERLEGAERATAIERGVHGKLQSNVVQFVRLFGAGEGQPQNDFFATVDQALFLTNGGPLQSWLKPSGDNLTSRLLKLETPEAVAEELYVTILSRLPDSGERQWVAEALGSDAEANSEIIQELAWALLTSAEFRFCP